jgi:hypothetical protein
MLQKRIDPRDSEAQRGGYVLCGFGAVLQASQDGLMILGYEFIHSHSGGLSLDSEASGKGGIWRRRRSGSVMLEIHAGRPYGSESYL